jgi:hypothetical protein
VSIFVERFVLPILATAMTGVIILNPFKWDVRQRIASAVAIIAIAYFVSHTMMLKRTETPPANLTVAPLTPVPPSITTGPVTTSGPDSPVVIGGGTVSLDTPPDKKKPPKGKKP